MSYYNYDYPEIGLLHQNAMLAIGLTALFLIIALLMCAGRHRQSIPQAGNRWNTIRSLVKQSYIGKYSNSYIGILWNFITPVLLSIIICYVFMSIKDLYPDRNYGVYICSGFFVATACRYGLMGRSFKGSSQVVRKTSAPGWVIVLADTLSQFVILVVALVTTLIIRAVLGDPFVPESVLCIPVLLAVLFVFCFGLTLFFSTLTVLSDDLGQIASLLGRVIVWISPVFFYLSGCKSSLESACMWNPFTYFIEPFHQAISYGTIPNAMMLVTASLIALLAFAAGMLAYLHYYDKVREQI